MKHILLLALVVIVYMPHAFSIPATLCRFVLGNTVSRARYQLVVRNTYDGQAWGGGCSSDGIFCIGGGANSVVILKYQNIARNIPPNAWNTINPDDWCKAKGGWAYWFEV